MCRADTPIVNLMNFDSREYDLRKLQREKEQLTEFHVVNLTTRKFFGWQMAYYCFINQWNYSISWRDYIGKLTTLLFGKRTGFFYRKSLEFLYKVEAVEKSEKYGIVFPKKYSYLYLDIVYLDFEKTFNIKNERSFVKNLKVIHKDLEYYYRLIKKSKKFLNNSMSCCENNKVFFYSDFVIPIDWTISFFTYRICLLKSFCNYLYSKDSTNSMSFIIKAKSLVSEAIKNLNYYNSTMQYFGSDMGRNLLGSSLKKLERIFINIIQNKDYEFIKNKSLGDILQESFTGDDLAEKVFNKFCKF